MRSIERVEIPSRIQEYLINANKSTFQRKPNHYWVTDICRCLRRSYYEITNTPHDNPEVKPEIEKLWTPQSRKLLHNLSYAFKWRELDIEKEFLILDQSVFLHGRLDMYDYKTGNIIDLKTTNAVN